MISASFSETHHTVIPLPPCSKLHFGLSFNCNLSQPSNACPDRTLEFYQLRYVRSSCFHDITSAYLLWKHFWIHRNCICVIAFPISTLISIFLFGQGQHNALYLIVLFSSLSLKTRKIIIEYIHWRNGPNHIPATAFSDGTESVALHDIFANNEEKYVHLMGSAFFRKSFLDTHFQNFTQISPPTEIWIWCVLEVMKTLSEANCTSIINHKNRLFVTAAGGNQNYIVINQTFWNSRCLSKTSGASKINFRCFVRSWICPLSTDQGSL